MEDFFTTSRTKLSKTEFRKVAGLARLVINVQVQGAPGRASGINNTGITGINQ